MTRKHLLAAILLYFIMPVNAHAARKNSTLKCTLLGKVTYICIYKICTCIASSTSTLSWGDGDQGQGIGLVGQLGQVHGGVQNVDDQAITSEKRSRFT